MVLSGVFFLAYLVRFDFELPHSFQTRVLIQAPFVVLLQLACLAGFGVYSFIWRYVGIAEIAAFLKAALISVLPLIILRSAMPETLREGRIPLSVILVDTIFAFGGVLALRVLRRVIHERFEKRADTRARGQSSKKPVLLVGAGRAGLLAAKELLSRGSDLLVCGFIDDDDEKQGSVLQGVKVLGRTADLPRLVRELSIDHVVITISNAGGAEFRRVIELCEKIPVKARVIPGLSDILEGNVSVSRIRNVEIEDLLGRDPVQLDVESMRELLDGKTVMVTGAGGSIGSELVRQVSRFNPARVLLVERAEGALFNIDRELRDAAPSLEVVPLIADVCDVPRMEAIFRNTHVDVVFHAAAHKHVPMMEKNPAEAIKNNALGTRAVAELAGRHGSAAFVLISTDKAVNPTSVMGASKRVAELIVQGLQSRFRDTRFVAVRFGNVLGSTGSVIPIFREQILKGGPVTVTHPDMVRYFMTIPEASQLVIQAGALGKGGEIFILDMGEPVRIVDLAKDMIRLSGLRPEEDIDIVFSGIRPGEKLFEELETTGEEITKTRHPKIFIGRIAGVPQQQLDAALRDIIQSSQSNDPSRVVASLSAFLPEARLGGRPHVVAAAQEAERPLAAPAQTLTLAAAES